MRVEDGFDLPSSIFPLLECKAVYPFSNKALSILGYRRIGAVTEGNGAVYRRECPKTDFCEIAAWLIFSHYRNINTLIKKTNINFEIMRKAHSSRCIVEEYCSGLHVVGSSGPEKPPHRLNFCQYSGVFFGANR